VRILRPAHRSEHERNVHTYLSFPFPKDRYCAFVFAFDESTMRWMSRAEVRHCIADVGVGVEFLGSASRSTLGDRAELRIPT
jgi:hypothetical protein